MLTFPSMLPAPRALCSFADADLASCGRLLPLSIQCSMDASRTNICEGRTGIVHTALQPQPVRSQDAKKKAGSSGCSQCGRKVNA